MSRIASLLWKHRRLITEAVWPYVGAIIATSIAWYLLTEKGRLLFVVDLLGLFINMMSLFTGTLITSLCLLIPKDQLASVKRLKTSALHFRLLAMYHGESLVFGSISLIIAFLVAAFCKQVNEVSGQTVFTHTAYSYTMFQVWVFVTSLAIGTTVRVGYTMVKIALQSVSVPSPPTGRRPSSPVVSDTFELVEESIQNTERPQVLPA